MITAKEARVLFESSDLVVYLKEQGHNAVARSAERGCCGTSVSLLDAPSRMSRPCTADIAKKIYESYGYKVSTSADSKTVYLSW